MSEQDQERKMVLQDTLTKIEQIKEKASCIEQLMEYYTAFDVPAIRKADPEINEEVKRLIFAIGHLPFIEDHAQEIIDKLKEKLNE